MTLTSKGSSFTLGPEKYVKHDPCNTPAGAGKYRSLKKKEGKNEY